MSGQTPVLNTQPQEPALADLLDLLKKEILLGLNCHHVGKVQSFDASRMTVYATVNYTKTFFQLNTATKTYVPVQVNYPVVVDAPIICLGGGPVNLTMPIAKGDECLLIFNDRDIDNWFASGSTTQGPATNRLHAFTDALALMGPKSIPHVIAAYDTVRALLTDGNVALGINPSNHKVRIANASVGPLNAVLQNILTQLQNLTTALGTTYASNLILVTGSAGNPSPINPSAASAISAVGTQLSTYATQLGNLLE